MSVTRLMPATPGRQLPHDFNCERALLAACLLDGAEISRARQTGLAPEHFADPLHGQVFKVMDELQQNGQAVNPFTLEPIFEGDDVVTAAGGPMKFFGEHIGGAFTHFADAPQLVRQIIDASHRREMVTAGESIIARALSPSAASAADEMAAAGAELSARAASIGGERQGEGPALMTATPYDWTVASAIAPREAVGPGRHYFRRHTCGTIGAGASAKTSLVLLDAVSAAAGRDLITGATMSRRRVWVWNGEDPLEELQRRIQAIALHYGLTPDDLGDRLFIDSGRNQRMEIARDDRRNGIVIARPHVESIIKTITSNRIDIFIVDPFVSTHGVPENDNGAIDRVAKEFGRIADAANCAVEIVHHVRKTNGGELTADDARGAVALIAAARSVRVINPMTLDEAAKAGIEPKDRRSYFRVDNAKANLAPAGEHAGWRRVVGVGLGNGTDHYPEDNVAVVTAWQWPDAFAGMTADDLRAVQNKVASGKWRDSVQAADWVGLAVAEVLGLDLDDAASKQRVKTLVKGWTDSGALKVVDGKDAKSNPRKMIEVGTWAT